MWGLEEKKRISKWQQKLQSLQIIVPVLEETVSPPPLSQGTNTSPMQREGTEEAEEGGDTYCGPNYVGAVLDIVYLT